MVQSVAMKAKTLKGIRERAMNGLSSLTTDQHNLVKSFVQIRSGTRRNRGKLLKLIDFEIFVLLYFNFKQNIKIFKPISPIVKNN